MCVCVCVCVCVKEILPFATMWMDPEGFLLCNLSQTVKTNTIWLINTWGLRKNQQQLKQSSLVFARSGGGGGLEEMGDGQRFKLPVSK